MTKPNPADIYLERDASDLARIVYGMTLAEVCTRLHWEKRQWIAAVLVSRGWPVSNVSRALGYKQSANLYYHLDKVKGA